MVHTAVVEEVASHVVCGAAHLAGRAGVAV